VVQALNQEDGEHVVREQDVGVKYLFIFFKKDYKNGIEGVSPTKILISYLYI
tara:strand:+ start:2053 stop:2208 length:156 start_codon:yes stop_codon:yes gene_type:complete